MLPIENSLATCVRSRTASVYACREADSQPIRLEIFFSAMDFVLECSIARRVENGPLHHGPLMS